MKLSRRKFLHLSAGAVALPALPRWAWAQSYPIRPARIVVHFPPGQATDTVARLIGQSLTERLGQGFVIENLLAHMPDAWQATYYRTGAQAEIDLILEGPRRAVIAIEVKRTLTPSVSKGFRLGCEDIRATRRFYVTPHGETYPLAADTQAVGVGSLVTLLMREWAR